VAPEVDGVALDLVVTNTTQYLPWDSSNTGVLGKFAQINMRARQQATFRFCFVESGTYTPVTIESVAFTFYDFDNGRMATTDDVPAAIERLHVSNFSSFDIPHRRAGLCVLRDEFSDPEEGGLKDALCNDVKPYETTRAPRST